MSSQGPKFPTSASGNTNAGAGGTVAWTNPQNIEAADGVFATCNNGGASIASDDLIGTGFGFSVPATATVNGILAEINYSASNSAAELVVQLIKGGALTGNNKATGAALPASPATVSYGGSADLWGGTFTPADINASNFGVDACYFISSGFSQANVDFFRITVFYTTPAPTVSSCLPASGLTSGGNSVTITGTNFFATPTSITFGGAAATNIVFNSSTSVSCTAPAHAAGAVNVVVTNPDGQSGTGTNVYTYNNPAPTVSSCSPSSGLTSGGNSVTITGTGFLATPTSITFGGAAATNIVFNSATSVSCTAPAHAAGAVNVVVTNPDGQSGTGTNVYTYNNPPPAFNSCTPGNGAAAGGTSVTISGANFLATPTVTFGGVAASNVTFVSSTSLTCTTPAQSPVTVDIGITNPDGQSTTGSKAFLYLGTGSRFLSF